MLTGFSFCSLSITVLRMKFQVTYTNGDGIRVTEYPRLAITVDGREKSLVLGESSVLATLPYGEPDADLWKLAKANLSPATPTGMSN